MKTRSTAISGRIGLCMWGIAAGIMTIQGVHASPDHPLQPAWWADRGVQTATAANDDSPVNQGQVKWMATQAGAEFEEKLPGTANSNITALVSSFTSSDNYLPANLGQLKSASKPFYDRLMGLGLIGHYPWMGDSTLKNDYAIATVGQLKDFFSFELPNGTNIYYVATSGADNNPGTFEHPFRTIQHAVDRLVPGDTVLIRGGTYREQVSLTASGTPDHPITIAGYGDEYPVIKGSDIVTNWVHYQDNIYMVTNWTINSQQVFDDGVPLQQIGYPSPHYENNPTCYTPVGLELNDMVPGSFFYDEDDSRLYVWLPNNQPPPKEGLEVSTRAIPIDGREIAYIKLARLKVRNSSSVTRAGMTLGYHSTIRNSDIQWCCFAGLKIESNSAAINCIISHNGNSGIDTSNATNLFIRNCTITHNNYRSFNPSWHAGGMKLIPDCSGTVEKCEISYNNGHGVWFDWCNSGNDIVIRNNHIHHNQYGVFFEASKNADIYNNLVVDNDTGICIAESDNTRVFNNTIVSTFGTAGIFSRISSSRISSAGEAGTFINNRYFNNLLYNNSSTYEIVLPAQTPYIYDNQSDYNCVYRDDGPAKFGSYAPPASGLENWQQMSGQDLHSMEVHPTVLNPRTGNYGLAATSLCIDAGTNLTELASIPNDYLGRPRIAQGTVDIGACEFGGFDDQSRPNIWITDPGSVIPYDSNVLTGCMNGNVVGAMGALVISDETTNWVPVVSSSVYEWTLRLDPLDVGRVYTITIYGTNAVGSLTQQTITVTRGDIGTGTPVVSITTLVPLVVESGTVQIYGTNNLHVADDMAWSNEYNHAYVSGGAFSAANGQWNLELDHLLPGRNEIHVFGTNDMGVATSDSILVDYGGTTNHFVAMDSPAPIYPFTSWDSAAHSIQEAVDAAMDGDTVWATNGIYQTGFAEPVSGRTRVLINRGIRVHSVNGPQATVIKGNSDYPQPPYTRCVTLDHVSAELVGFTLRDGYANGMPYGGGLLILDVNMISNCVISSCFSPYSAGGVCVSGQNGKGHGWMTDCLIISNTAKNAGGGMILRWGQNFILGNSVISNNHADGKAGGLIIDNCRQIRNCLIFDNTAGGFGGGVVLGNNASIYNCTIENNSASRGGGVAMDSPLGNGASIYNSILFHNNPNNFSMERTNLGKPYRMEYCCTDWLPTNLTSTVGSITNDPIYIYPYEVDYRVTTNSPCRDSATLFNWMESTQALNPTNRILFGQPDMGCYEFDGSPEFNQPFVEVYSPTGLIAYDQPITVFGGKNANVVDMEASVTTHGIATDPAVVATGPYGWSMESIAIQPGVTNKVTIIGRNAAGVEYEQTFSIIRGSEP